MKKGEIGNPTIGQTVDGVAYGSAHNQAQRKRGESIPGVCEPNPEQRNRGCLESQQHPLRKRSLGLEQAVADAGVARENDIQERTEPHWPVGSEVEHVEKVDLADLIEQTSDRSHGKPETGLGADEVGFYP